MRRWLIPVSATFHIALVFGLFVAGAWRLEQLDRPHISVALAQPLPPPPAPAGGAAPTKAPKLTPKVVVHDPVQPVPRPVEAPTPLQTAVKTGGGEGSGEGSGRGSGDPLSTGDCTENCGDGSGSAKVPEKKVEEHHDDLVVPPSVIRGMRISGETQLHPSDLDKTAMSRDGKERVTASFKTCVNPAGAVASVAMIKSSGYPAYDQEIAAAMRAWRYRPYVIGSQAVMACGIVTFVYQIK